MYRETLDDTPLHVKDAALPGPSEAAGLALSSGPPQSHATRANTSKLQSIWKAFCALDVPPSRYALGSLRQVPPTSTRLSRGRQWKLLVPPTVVAV